MGRPRKLAHGRRQDLQRHALGACEGACYFRQMDEVERLARRLAVERLERDRRIALEHHCPSLLRLEAYLPQTRKDAAVVIQFSLRPVR